MAAAAVAAVLREDGHDLSIEINQRIRTEALHDQGNANLGQAGRLDDDRAGAVGTGCQETAVGHRGQRRRIDAVAGLVGHIPQSLGGWPSCRAGLDRRDDELPPGAAAGQAQPASASLSTRGDARRNVEMSRGNRGGGRRPERDGSDEGDPPSMPGGVSGITTGSGPTGHGCSPCGPTCLHAGGRGWGEQDSGSNRRPGKSITVGKRSQSPCPTPACPAAARPGPEVRPEGREDFRANQKRGASWQRPSVRPRDPSARERAADWPRRCRQSSRGPDPT